MLYGPKSYYRKVKTGCLFLKVLDKKNYAWQKNGRCSKMNYNICQLIQKSLTLDFKTLNNKKTKIVNIIKFIDTRRQNVVCLGSFFSVLTTKVLKKRLEFPRVNQNCRIHVNCAQFSQLLDIVSSRSGASGTVPRPTT